MESINEKRFYDALGVVPEVPDGILGTWNAASTVKALFGASRLRPASRSRSPFRRWS